MDFDGVSPQKAFLDRFCRSAAQFASLISDLINQIDEISNSDRKNEIIDDTRIQDLARRHINYRSQRENNSLGSSRGGKKD